MSPHWPHRCVPELLASLLASQQVSPHVRGTLLCPPSSRPPPYLRMPAHAVQVRNLQPMQPAFDSTTQARELGVAAGSRHPAQAAGGAAEAGGAAGGRRRRCERVTLLVPGWPEPALFVNVTQRCLYSILSHAGALGFETAGGGVSLSVEDLPEGGTAKLVLPSSLLPSDHPRAKQVRPGCSSPPAKKMIVCVPSSWEQKRSLGSCQQAWAACPPHLEMPPCALPPHTCPSSLQNV